MGTASPGKDDDLSSLVDCTQIATSKHTGPSHNSDVFRSLSTKLPRFKKMEKNLTNEFFKSLELKVPDNEIKLVNVHIYGAPGVGKSVLARATGFHIKQFYGDKCQCLECQFLPDSIHSIDPSKTIIVISVDDPMGGADKDGSQDARDGMSEDVKAARATFNAIRHIYAKRILLYRAERYYGKPVPDDIIKAIELYHDHRDKLEEILPEISSIGAILYIIWGPQLPTIDQTFHQNKMWNIYKGFSAMDEKRESEMRRHLGSFWMNKLGEKEKSWRRHIDEDAKSWSILEDPFTKEKGWLYVQPGENIFKKVPRGGKTFQVKIRDDTEKMDTWARYIYENKDSLMPPYDPFGKKEDRSRALSNFLTDVLKSDKDPRTFDNLPPHIRIFMKNVFKSKISILDNRIIKYHFANLNERDQIESIAQQLVRILEEEGLSPHMTSGRPITHDIARRKITTHKQLIDKAGNFKKIFDHLLYLWYQVHPEDSKRKIASSASKISNKNDAELVEHATVEAPGNIIEFSITEKELITSIIEENKDWTDRALIYMHSEGIGNRDILTNRQIYQISLNEKQRKNYGFTEAFTSIEAVKYRKQQFRGIMSYKLGKIFEDWVEQVLLDGCYIPGIIENVATVTHSSYEKKGNPDIILQHDNGSYSVVAIKCYASQRSETLEKEEITPEMRYHNTLLQKGEKSRIVVIYQNIQIPHMLVVYVYNQTSEIPTNLTFSPNQQNHFFFRKSNSKSA